jgi:hypothetical protein
MRKFSKLTGKSASEWHKIAKSIGKILADAGCEVVLLYDYITIRQVIGEEYKKHGGKLTMLWTDKDEYWQTKKALPLLKYADKKIKKKNWTDTLFSLVSDVDVVLVCGLSTGVFVELGFMKFSLREGKQYVKKIIGIKELLRDKKFPPEIDQDLKKITEYVSYKDLGKVLNRIR